MTEEEWLAGTEPTKMFGRYFRMWNRPSKRKCRLYLSACLRRLSERLKDERCWRAIEVLELSADGVAGDQDVLAARQEVDAALGEVVDRHSPEAHAIIAVWYALSAGYNIGAATSRASMAASGVRVQGEATTAERERQAVLLRDIIGNPFHLTTIEPSWLTWNDGAVRMIAKTIYDERRFQELPILANALEEACCTDAGILIYCRGPEPHVRGCWVLDLVLGKE